MWGSERVGGFSTPEFGILPGKAGQNELNVLVPYKCHLKIFLHCNFRYYHKHFDKFLYK